MRLEKEKVRISKFYRIGYINPIDKYVLACMITGSSWYERFYVISKEEYSLSNDMIEQLDILADKLRNLEVFGKRFIFSDLIEENTDEQILLYKECKNRMRDISQSYEMF